MSVAPTPISNFPFDQGEIIWFSHLNQSKSDFNFIGPVECDLNVLILSGEIIWFSYVNQSKRGFKFIGPLECDLSVKQTSPPCLVVVLCHSHVNRNGFLEQ